MNQDAQRIEKPEQTGPNPLAMIVQGINGLMKWHSGKTIDEIAGKLVPISSQLAHLETCQQQNLYAIEGLRKQLDAIAVHSQLLDAASRENSRLSQEYYQEHVVEPMARGIFPVIDLIEDARNSWLENGCVIEPDIYQLIDGIHILLCQFLLIYQIERIRHEPGVEFDPQVMKPAQVVPIHTSELDNRIAKSLQAGFCSMQPKRPLRAESVIVYRFRGA